MSNRHQPPIKFSKYDNPAASQRVLELARGGKVTKPPQPLLPSKQVIGYLQAMLTECKSSNQKVTLK
jgi:hypothetical protein